MRHLVGFLFISLGLISCVNNSNHGYMTESEFESSRPAGKILVPTSFRPTLELTDEIRNASLEDLIIQKKGQYSTRDRIRREEWLKEKIEYHKAISLANGERFTKKDEAIIRSISEDQEPPLSYPDQTFGETDLKFVPDTSNLAKVYYLEDKGGFKRNNKDYYQSIENKQKEEAREKWNRETQRIWEKYL